MLKSFAIRCSAALLILTAAAGVAFAQEGPVAVQQQLFDDLARGDVVSALALFTDDAVIDAESGLCAPAPCVGKDAIRKDLERIAADKSRRVTPLNTYVSGKVLVTRFEARSDVIQKAGVDRIILWSIREMRGNKSAATRCCYRNARLADRSLSRMGICASVNRIRSRTLPPRHCRLRRPVMRKWAFTLLILDSFLSGCIGFGFRGGRQGGGGYDHHHDWR